MVAEKAAPAATGAAPTLSLVEKGLVMTVPANQEKPHSMRPARSAASERAWHRTRRGSRLLVVGAVAVALAVVALVVAFPGLDAPIGTAAGVVAVIVPLAQAVRRSGSASEESGNEP